MENDTIEIKVLFFAKAKDIVGKKDCTVNTPKRIKYVQLLSKIVSEFGLESIKNSIVISINEELCDSGEENVLELKAGDEIAIIPPLSGG